MLLRNLFVTVACPNKINRIQHSPPSSPACSTCKAAAAGRATWAWSWILDLGEEERAKGKTHQLGKAWFETDNRIVTILDAPGHKAFVPEVRGACLCVGVHLCLLVWGVGGWWASFN